MKISDTVAKLQFNIFDKLYEKYKEDKDLEDFPEDYAVVINFCCCEKSFWQVWATLYYKSSPYRSIEIGCAYNSYGKSLVGALSAFKAALNTPDITLNKTFMIKSLP